MKPLDQYNAYEIPCEQIYCDHDFNCRDKFTLDSLRPLASNILAVGLQEPILLQHTDEIGPLPDGKLYRILCGHRRFISISMLLSRVVIASRVVNGLSARQSSLINFVENLQRKDLNPWEEAQAILRLYPNGFKIREVARDLSKDTRWVSERKWLLGMPPSVQQMVASGRLPLKALQDLKNLSSVTAIQREAEKYVRHRDARKKRKSRAERPLTQSSKRRRSKAEISDLIVMLLSQEITGLPISLLGWSAGTVSDYAVRQDLKEFISERNQ